MFLRIFTEPQQGASYEQLLAVARTAEELGFDGYFRSDHYLTMGGDGLPGPTDAWVTLAAIARETSTIRLGTLVTSATFRLPGPLAISVAEVDHMSGGRVELGLGAGWYEAEHTAYGIPFPSVGERFDRLEEQLAIVTGLWDTPPGERFSHTGRHYQLDQSPGAAQASPTAPTPDHRRRWWAGSDPESGGPVRLGVQPCLSPVGRDPRVLRTGTGSVPSSGPRPVIDRAVRGPGDLLRTERRGDLSTRPRRSGGRSTNCGRTDSAAHRTR